MAAAAAAAAASASASFGSTGEFLCESSVSGKDLSEFDVLEHGFRAFGSGRNTGLPEEILYAMYISIVHCGRKDIFDEFYTDIDKGDEGDFLSPYKNERQKRRDLKKLKIGLPILNKLEKDTRPFVYDEVEHTIDGIIATTQDDTLGKTADVILRTSKGVYICISIKNYTGKKICLMNPTGKRFGVTEEDMTLLWETQKEDIRKLQKEERIRKDTGVKGKVSTVALCTTVAAETLKCLMRKKLEMKLASDLTYMTSDDGREFVSKPADMIVSFEVKGLKSGNKIIIKGMEIRGINQEFRTALLEGACNWVASGINLMFTDEKNTYISVQVKPNNGVESLKSSKSIFSSWNASVFTKEVFTKIDHTSIKLE